MQQNTHNTVLMVMDMQEMILGPLPNTAPLIQNVASAITHARNNDIPIIYAIVAFRPGAPEINMNNKFFTAMGPDKWTPEFLLEWMKIHPDVAPIEGDIIVTKRRFSAFTGSDLEVILRAKNIKRMVLTGVSTSGVVLSTTREAADMDYQLTILSDCCADRDDEVHHVLTTKVFPRQAEVMTVEEWIEG